MVKSTTLIVEGMTCKMCVKHVTNALENITGVTKVDVTLHPGTADVTYDPEAAGMEDFKEAVAEAGYTVTGAR